MLYFISLASGGISLHHTEHCIGSRACTACQWVPQQGQGRRQGQVPVFLSGSSNKLIKAQDHVSYLFQLVFSQKFYGVSFLS